MGKKIIIFKDFTYYSLIKEAIYSTGMMKATAKTIISYFSTRHPEIFRNSNSMTWKGNIRHNLSKNPEFIKTKETDGKREHFWTHRPLEVLIADEKKLVNIRDKETFRNRNNPRLFQEMAMLFKSPKPQGLEIKRENEGLKAENEGLRAEPEKMKIKTEPTRFYKERRPMEEKEVNRNEGREQEFIYKYLEESY